MQCVRECAGKWFMFSQENDFPDNLESGGPIAKFRTHARMHLSPPPPHTHTSQSLVSLFGPLQPEVGGK